MLILMLQLLHLLLTLFILQVLLRELLAQLTAECFVLRQCLFVFIELGDKKTPFVLEFEDLLGYFLAAADDFLKLSAGGLDVGVVHEGVLDHGRLQGLVLVGETSKTRLNLSLLALQLIVEGLACEQLRLDLKQLCLQVSL